MRIEKLNENKIRVFFNLEDLQEKNINLHTFMSNSVETQDLFLDILNKAETEVGFKTNNYKIAIETLAASDGNFILTVTRIKPESLSIAKFHGQKPQTKRISITPNKLLSIYIFNSFDEFCDFCNYINTTHLNKCISKFRNSSLVLYKSKYYLVLYNLKLTVADLKSFSFMISEFATPIKDAGLLDRKLKEYGKTIINKNAISTCLEYFN